MSSTLPAMLFVKDVQSRQYLTVNRAGEHLIGRPRDAILGRTDLELFPEYGAGYEQRDNDAIERPDRPHVFESVFTRDDGQAVHLRTTRKLIDGPHGPNQYLLGISEDVTQTRVAQAEALRLAQYDALTGLLNRASYNEKLHAAVKSNRPFALLAIDLDRFKAINDQYGHVVGDAALTVVGERLQAQVTSGDWVARIGGDEFIVVLFGPNLRQRAHAVADRIVDALCEPIKTRSVTVRTGASIGGVLMPDDGHTLQQLRENADLALYRAKGSGRCTATFFDAQMDAEARDRKTLETALRLAIEKRSVGLAFQPLISAQTGHITSAEALARWVHPSQGPIRPDIFIPIAEECGLIDALGEQILRQACAEAQGWHLPVRVAVNLSPIQFLSGKLPETVRTILAETGLTPGRLQLEVTESLVIRDVERTFVQLQQLRDIGIQILIDDFGVGYSSLSYFQRFPFDKVKIDKSFIDEITTSRTSRAIVQAVVGLGSELDMGIVAEGVETEAQRAALTALGCTHLQGYLFSAPLPASAFRALLTKPLFTGETTTNGLDSRSQA